MSNLNPIPMHRIFKNGATAIQTDASMANQDHEQIRAILKRSYPEIAHATGPVDLLGMRLLRACPQSGLYPADVLRETLKEAVCDGYDLKLRSLYPSIPTAHPPHSYIHAQYIQQAGLTTYNLITQRHPYRPPRPPSSR